MASPGEGASAAPRGAQSHALTWVAGAEKSEIYRKFKRAGCLRCDYCEERLRTPGVAISEGGAETFRRGQKFMWQLRIRKNPCPLSRLGSRWPMRKPESASLPDPADPAVPEPRLRTHRKLRFQSVLQDGLKSEAT